MVYVYCTRNPRALEGIDPIKIFRRQTAVADHALHGQHALRRERRRPVRQYAHRAGLAIPEAYNGDRAALSDADWKQLGFSESVVHTDLFSTTDRTVIALLRDGSSRVIYRSGRFTLDS